MLCSFYLCANLFTYLIKEFTICSILLHLGLNQEQIGELALSVVFIIQTATVGEEINVDLTNLSKQFYKALDAINKLSEKERLTLCTLLTTVDHSNPKSETTYKTYWNTYEKEIK